MVLLRRVRPGGNSTRPSWTRAPPVALFFGGEGFFCCWKWRGTCFLKGIVKMNEKWSFLMLLHISKCIKLGKCGFSIWYVQIWSYVERKVADGPILLVWPAHVCLLSPRYICWTSYCCLWISYIQICIDVLTFATDGEYEVMFHGCMGYGLESVPSWFKLLFNISKRLG